ncbi:hypothetical protein [Acetobacter fallax]|uniref:Transposase n=1 Tax=Acetobacter fallax TaxID=1737473 RepID=A0ABX0K9T5_9PROT|nr:hypothetical protein [Acetobacter fallax]NHO31736.1 hypothetical protein [Acetobacter fallax]NHO35295.1 hypothetical protein [Acetobacter fallax]
MSRMAGLETERHGSRVVEKYRKNYKPGNSGTARKRTLPEYETSMTERRWRIGTGRLSVR